jgi:glycogen debranching enzyme
MSRTVSLESSPWNNRSPVAAVVQPARHVTLVEGQTFCIAAASGDMHAALPEGLFYLDARVLSRWELRLNGHPIEPLAVATTEPFAAMHVTRGAPAVGHADADVVVLRTRHVCAGMRERLAITNHGLEPIPVLLELFCDVDFADVFEVKESRVRRRGDHDHFVASGELVFTHEHRGVRRRTRVVPTGEPVLEPGLVAWRHTLNPRETWNLCIEVVNVVNDTEIEERFRCGEDRVEPPVHRYDAWLARQPAVDSDRDDLLAAIRRAAEDLGALRIVDPHTQLAVPAAGAPWFMTLFGRDSLLTSWMALPVDPGLAYGVLRSLARMQGTRVDPVTEEEPGRIMHEVRFAGEAGLALGGGDVYYGSVDATPLFVMLLGELRRWGLHDDLVGQLLTHADRALEWIERFGDRDGDGYVEYHRATSTGLANQGWKDSWDAVRFADGRMAESPIALCEVQAYVYGAYVARAHFASEAGDDVTFAAYRDKAEALRRRFNVDFWLEDEGTFALGLDADKRPIDAVTSNAGHCLWAGIAEPDKAARVAKRLLQRDMFSGWGVRTLSTSMAAYNPVSYHNGSVWPHDNALCAAGLARYGHLDEAHRIIDGQLAVAATAAGELPELFAGFDRAAIPVPAAYPASCTPQAWAAASPLLWLRTLLGLAPWAPHGKVWLSPSLPPNMTRLRVEGVEIGETKLTVAVDGDTVDVELDGGLEVVAERRGPMTAIIEPV